MVFQDFAIALGLGPAGWVAIAISGIAFLTMFGIASATGDYQGMIDSMIAKPSEKKKVK